MLRLDPALPPLWRTPSTLQFGLDPVSVVHDPTPWQERLLRELEHGIPESALGPIASALGAPDGAGADFVRRIRRALAPTSAPAELALLMPDDASEELRWALVHAIELAGATATIVHREERVDAPTIVVAHHVLAPRAVAPLMAADRPHLPFVIGGGAIDVGPFVVPGRTACAACLALHRRDVDPQWPVVAAQLVGRPAPPLDGALVIEAGIVAVRLIAEAQRHPRRQSAPALRLRSGAVHRSMRTRPPHAECRCRSLAENAMPSAPVVLAPTRSRAYARPA